METTELDEKWNDLIDILNKSNTFFAKQKAITIYIANRGFGYICREFAHTDGKFDCIFVYMPELKCRCNTEEELHKVTNFDCAIVLKEDCANYLSCQYATTREILELNMFEHIIERNYYLENYDDNVIKDIKRYLNSIKKYRHSLCLKGQVIFTLLKLMGYDRSELNQIRKQNMDVKLEN